MTTSPKSQLKTDCNRRQFLGRSAALGTAVMLSTTGSGCASQPETVAPLMPRLSGLTPHVSSAWINRGGLENAGPLMDRMLASATDFAWLSPGDTVLIKLALNSGNPYPATSDPWMLEHLIRILREKGAGEIRVGDQSGVEHVYCTEEKQEGSSRQLCRSAGLLEVIEKTGATPVFFEEAGYQAYFSTQPAGEHHWSSPIWISKAVNEVDHIIYLPRVASHLMGDITSALKIGVGFLRDDSRLDFHRGGRHFYAMYEEINQVPEIKEKLRLTVTSGRHVLSTFGPDNGDVSHPDPGLIFASDDLLASELMAYSWLKWNRENETSFFERLTKGNINRFRSFINERLVETIWEPTDDTETPDMPVFRAGDIHRHPAIQNRMARLGGRPERIVWTQVNPPADTRISDYLQQQLNG